MRRESTKGIENVRIASNLLMDHKTQNTHLGSTSIIQFNGTLLVLFFVTVTVPSKVKEPIAEVTGEFSGTIDILHDKDFQESNECQNLQKTAGGDVTQACKARLDTGKARSRVINITGNTNTTGGGDVSRNGKHGNTSVLQFHITKTIETRLILIQYKIQRIPESQRLLSTHLFFEGLDGGGGGLTTNLSSGSKGGSRASKKGKNGSSLHGRQVVVLR
mmetsp:Transcript_28988/g.37885  ORF Transcript_28988/g.37885 Transcript_28988/m.37885 type:complete len:218 (+) Transcript_28988:195-848(+)